MLHPTSIGPTASPVRVAYLGPEATFTHMAVQRQFGTAATAAPLGSIAAVFAEVAAGAAAFGVVPVENSTEGVVNHTLDSFVASDLRISAEVVLPVRHCMLARANAEPIARVYSHPQALAQCRGWLHAHLPEAVTVETASTAEAARRVGSDPVGAAIASELAAEVYGLTILARDLADLAANATRFLVIGGPEAPPSGRDKTTFLLELAHRPGALQAVLAPFARRGVNLCKIESRPSRRERWEYVFFIDVEGHRLDPAVDEALAEAARACTDLKVIGSYPRATEAVV